MVTACRVRLFAGSVLAGVACGAGSYKGNGIIVPIS